MLDGSTALNTIPDARPVVGREEGADRLDDVCRALKFRVMAELGRPVEALWEALAF
jgi:hypothetical protein